MLLYHKVAEVAPGSCHPAIHVHPAQFVDQLALLRRLGAHAISLSDYVAYRRGNTELPPRPVVLTFDDGYLDNYEVALPILQQFGFSATVFLVSRLIGRTNVWDPDEPQVPLLGRAHPGDAAGRDRVSIPHVHACAAHDARSSGGTA